MATNRPRNAAQTRADILSVAAALVIRYFGSKQICSRRRPRSSG